MVLPINIRLNISCLWNRISKNTKKTPNAAVERPPEFLIFRKLADGRSAPTACSAAGVATFKAAEDILHDEAADDACRHNGYSLALRDAF